MESPTSSTHENKGTGVPGPSKQRSRTFDAESARRALFALDGSSTHDGASSSEEEDMPSEVLGSHSSAVSISENFGIRDIMAL